MRKNASVSTKSKSSRVSLTILLAVFVFAILLSAIALAALGIWLLSKANIFVDVNGELGIWQITLYMSLISIIIGGVIAFVGSHIQLRPINRIIDKMNRLASGDFKTRIHLKKDKAVHPTIKEFTDSFNKMAEELESTELLRNDFINDFSHEFKTPIVSIAGLANLIESGNLSDEERAGYVRAIREESMRLSSMANNVLNLSKVENQTILTDVSSFNLSEQLRSSVLLLEEKWTAKNTDLRIELDEYMIEANEELLKQVWINLIDNAVKFVSDSGIIEISINEVGGFYCVKISDTGAEIPKEKQGKIFNKFYQTDESHATKGNGIGLAIVKSIVELHSGTVDVLSENGVTTFTVSLPKEQNCQI